jgi:BirA family biotin operon repressor/biotin-[acetyl-CoA-carboxylase] ligase
MIIGSHIRFIKDLPSTNTYLSEMLRKEKPAEGLVVHTNFQSAGKGQQGNQWESQDGKNLLFSIILYPDIIRPMEHFLISMAVSLGIFDFLSEIVPDCKIKWPNDIFAANGKICGILIENSIKDGKIENTVAGIGLNVNQTDFAQDIPNPISIKNITGKDYDTNRLLEKLVRKLDLRYKELLSGEYKKLRADYVSSLYRLHEIQRFQTAKGYLSGRIIGITEHGYLQVEDQQKMIHEFSFKEIDFIK